MLIMIYDDFIALLKRAENSNLNVITNSEEFSYYENQLDTYLDSYFNSCGQQRQYEILKARSLGYKLEEIGNRYKITRERVRQIIDNVLSKIRNPQIIEGNQHLRNLYSFLYGIGEYDIKSFIYYLFPKKHVVLLIISNDLYKKSLGYEKEQKKIEIKKQKQTESKKRAELRSQQKFAEKKEMIRLIKLCVINGDYEYATLGSIADSIMDDYTGKNRYQTSNRLTWSKLMEVIIEMQQKNKLKRRYGKFIIE